MGMLDNVVIELKELRTENKELKAEIERLKTDAEEHPFHMACSKCRRTHELLQKQVDKLKAEREWQPIETAPKDRTDFLALQQFSEMTLCIIAHADTATLYDNIGEFGKYITHWMPLPQPPEEK